MLNGQTLVESIESNNIPTGTLLAGETTLTITSETFTVDGLYDFYTDIYGVNPTDVSVSEGSVTLTFEAQSSDVNVKVRCL